MKWPPETSILNGHDYGFTVESAPPPGYPDTLAPDAFAETPFAADFATRRQAYLDHVCRNPAPNTFKSPYHELVRLAAGGVPHEGIFLAACDFIDARKDCSDFVLHALLRLLYQFPQGLSQPVLERMRRTVLGFKYWPDEPGIDSLCTWTENHQILYAAGAFLAGQLFPDAVFVNSGRTGQEQMAAHLPRIRRWLDLRFRTGFSEWLSNVYYDEDLTALLSLIDFAGDDGLRRQAENVVNLILFDLALNSFRGVFGSTHGRSYENSKKWPWNEGTTETMKLLFGTGVFSGRDSMAAACFALSSRYRLPQVLYEVANDRRVIENRQRAGIQLKEMERWGLRPDNLEDGMVLLSLEAYLHPRTANLTLRMFDQYNWWDNAFFKPFQKYRGLIGWLRRLRLMPLLARLVERDVCRNTREEANLYTYRTPDYMLSSAVDYRAGYGGDQQHIWQATLGPGAVCFTTHPARRSGPTPDYWSGSGTLPRVGQVKNVLVAVYRIDTTPGLYLTNRLLFTHAWLPKEQFDEIVELGGWVIARKGDGYLALRSRNPYRWQTEAGEDQDREIIAAGKTNIWICELGSRSESGDWKTFIQAILATKIEWRELSVVYQSPSQGKVEYGWKGPLRVNGAAVSLTDFSRYANPFTQVPFPAEQIKIKAGEHSLNMANEI